ncbi:hypothetical protein CDD83_685 [Cordyceps sp. RAO-2017]|nr:hypothetical protein CDD83_685 [Cordyceps sp. RAO-2017]
MPVSEFSWEARELNASIVGRSGWTAARCVGWRASARKWMRVSGSAVHRRHPLQGLTQRSPGRRAPCNWGGAPESHHPTSQVPQLFHWPAPLGGHRALEANPGRAPRNLGCSGNRPACMPMRGIGRHGLSQKKGYPWLQPISRATLSKDEAATIITESILVRQQERGREDKRKFCSGAAVGAGALASPPTLVFLAILAFLLLLLRSSTRLSPPLSLLGDATFKVALAHVSPGMLFGSSCHSWNPHDWAEPPSSSPGSNKHAETKSGLLLAVAARRRRKALWPRAFWSAQAGRTTSRACRRVREARSTLDSDSPRAVGEADGPWALAWTRPRCRLAG